MKVKEESEKAGLNLNIQKIKIMASSPITSWQIDGKIMETASDFIFFGSKITADRDCSHEIKRCLLLGRKAMTNWDSIFKTEMSLCWQCPYSQNYHLSSSHVWMWELDHREDWEPKNWCLPTVVLEKTLERLLDSKEIKQVNSKDSQPQIVIGRTDTKAEAATLTTWYEEPTHWKRPWCWERSKARGELGGRRWDGWVASLKQWTWVWANSRRWWRTEKTVVLQSTG